MEKFSQTKVGTIIREKLRTEAKYITFRREHPELKLPPIAEVQKLLACLREKEPHDQIERRYRV